MLNSFKESLKYTFYFTLFYFFGSFFILGLMDTSGGGGWFFIIYIIPFTPVVSLISLLVIHFVLLNPYTGIFNQHLLEKDKKDKDI